MKKITILFLSVLTLGLSVASCSSDDDNNGGSASIEGKWELTQVGGVLNGQEFLEDVEKDGGCSSQTYEFTNDGKFKETNYESVNGKCEGETDNGTWTMNGNKITIKYTGETEGETSETDISGNKLKLKQTYSEGGLTVTAVLVYVKK